MWHFSNISLAAAAYWGLKLLYASTIRSRAWWKLNFCSGELGSGAIMSWLPRTWQIHQFSFQFEVAAIYCRALFHCGKEVVDYACSVSLLSKLDSMGEPYFLRLETDYPVVAYAAERRGEDFTVFAQQPIDAAVSRFTCGSVRVRQQPVGGAVAERLFSRHKR